MQLLSALWLVSLALFVMIEFTYIYLLKQKYTNTSVNILHKHMQQLC